MTLTSLRNSLIGGLAVALLGVALTGGYATRRPKAEKRMLYIGTYTSEKSKGIYRAEMDAETGALTMIGLAAETPSPSFLAAHPNKKYLYAVNEVSEYNGKPGGMVTAYAIQPDGTLKTLNQQSSEGASPCHLTVDQRGKAVLVANYSSGSVVALGIESDGRLKPASSVIKHQGSSVNKQRQEAPHAHCIHVDAANRFAFSADLGTDKILVYKLDAEKATLTPNAPPSASVAPGSGPRQFAWHPSGKFAFVNHELASKVSAFKYDAAKGTLTEIDVAGTLPPGGFQGDNYTSETAVHSSGKFLYVSNRGHHSIAVFAINQETGKLTFVEARNCGGEWPRHFTIDPSGKFLLSANQNSDNIAVFRINQETGELTPTGQSLAAPTPVCLRFL